MKLIKKSNHLQLYNRLFSSHSSLNQSIQFCIHFFLFLSNSYRFEAIKLKTLLKTYSGCLQLSSSSLFYISTIESSFSIPLHSLYATFNRTYYGYNRGLELFFHNGIQLFFVFHDVEERNAVMCFLFIYHS